MSLDTHIYDLIIIGSGPAGLSAAIYAGRAMIDTLILEKTAIGGQVVTTKEIVNYPGIPQTTGSQLISQMYEQAQNFDVLKKSGTVEKLGMDGSIKLVATKNTTYQTRSILIATGAQPRKIGFPGEEEFTGHGVAYCATCDGEFYKGKPVLVIGGGYAAAEEAVFLTRFASEVHVIIRKGDFSCAPSVAETAKRNPKIKMHYHTEVKEVHGDTQLREAVLVNNQTGEEWSFTKEGFGLFVLAGTEPQTEVFKGIINVTEDGYIPVDETMKTNIPGIYAAGDILPKDLRQIVTAVADGALAATEIQKYVAHQRKNEGLSDVSEEVRARQLKRLENSHSQVENKEYSKQSTTEGTVSENNSTLSTTATGEGRKVQKWFDEDMRKQLQTIFTRLTKSVEIALFLDKKGPKTDEMKSFMLEVASLSDKISVQEYTLTDKKAVEYKVTRPSTAVLVVDGHSTGVRYAGVPGGHETNSLILGLYNVASAGQEIEEDLIKRIKRLRPMKLEVCASLSCHFCPDVVAACQRISSLNNEVQGEMIDAVLYPELKEKYNLMSFPTLVINDGQKILYGAQTMDAILETLETI